MTKNVIIFYLVTLFSFSAFSFNEVCSEEEVPFCHLPIEERLLLPESLLHDIPMGIFAEPQTDIFLEKPLPLVNGIRDMYAHVDPRHEISNRPLEMALSYYHQLKDRIKKPQHLGIIDFKEHSSSPRLFLIDMKSGTVETFLVAHGEGSDPKNTGYPAKFSNRAQSHQSSLGAFITAETYSGKNGYSLRIDGIEPTNSNVRKRAVVIHGSKYVKAELKTIGRSWGCPAVDHRLSTQLINKIKGGTLFYTWFDQ